MSERQLLKKIAERTVALNTKIEKHKETLGKLMDEQQELNYLMGVLQNNLLHRLNATEDNEQIPLDSEGPEETKT